MIFFFWSLTSFLWDLEEKINQQKTKKVKLKERKNKDEACAEKRRWNLPKTNPAIHETEKTTRNDFNLDYGLETVQPLKQMPTFVSCYVPIKQYHEV